MVHVFALILVTVLTLPGAVIAQDFRVAEDASTTKGGSAPEDRLAEPTETTNAETKSRSEELLADMDLATLELESARATFAVMIETLRSQASAQVSVGERIASLEALERMAREDAAWAKIAGHADFAANFLLGAEEFSEERRRLLMKALYFDKYDLHREMLEKIGTLHVDLVERAANLRDILNALDGYGASQVRESLAACMQRSRTIPREPPLAIARHPERLELFNAFFADRPECAASTYALKAMYDCLGGEMGIVKSEYEAMLGAINLGDTPLSGEDLKKWACSLEEDHLIELVVSEKELMLQAEDWNDKFTEIVICRSAYLEWLDSRARVVHGFNNGEAIISALAASIRQEFSYDEEQHHISLDFIDQIKKDIPLSSRLVLISKNCR